MPAGRAKKDKGSKDGKRAAETAIQASMRGIIVLEPPKHTDRQQCHHCDPAIKDEGVDEDSSDPAVLRRIVRRQAALASAATRKATIAGRSMKPGLPSRAATPVTLERKSRHSPWRALLDRTGLQQMDPFSQLPVDFDAIRDPNILHSLFDYFITVAAPLMDIRLPSVADRHAGMKFLWVEELPYCALRSPSCFWAMMLGANSQLNNARGNAVAKDPLTLTLRHMTISSINLRLPQMDESCPDWGLMSSIAIIGCWEKHYGHESAWKAHRDGIKAFSQQLQNEQLRNEVFAHILSFANHDGCSVTDLLGVDFWKTKVPNDGFAQLARLTYMNTNLVVSLRNCRAVELAETDETRQRCLEETIRGIAQFAVRHHIVEVASTNPLRDREGDRQILTVHVIMQMAGVAVVQFLAAGAPKILSGLAQIDIPAMCNEAARLVSSVMHGQMYNEVLFWAVFTIGSLTAENVESLVLNARELSRRLKLTGRDDWQPVLRQFVLLDSARERYEHFRTQVEQASPFGGDEVQSLVG